MNFHSFLSIEILIVKSEKNPFKERVLDCLENLKINKEFRCEVLQVIIQNRIFLQHTKNI